MWLDGLGASAGRPPGWEPMGWGEARPRPLRSEPSFRRGLVPLSSQLTVTGVSCNDFPYRLIAVGGEGRHGPSGNPLPPRIISELHPCILFMGTVYHGVGNPRRPIHALPARTHAVASRREAHRGEVQVDRGAG